MDFTMAWEKQPSEPQEIAGERRGDRRYGIQLDLKWKLVRRRRVLDTGTGRTLDLSSSGVLFNAGRALPEGLNVELSIAWPVLLHNVAPLQLTVAGRIVRCEGRIIAVQMVQHEFRTVSTPAENRVGLSAAARTTSGLAAPFDANSGAINGSINGFGKPQ
jgi:PilZ domain